ncbi:MAG: TnpV protein, partial [Clostridia bacterium]|nr:TnpV protein [Clostridia bacterium]
MPKAEALTEPAGETRHYEFLKQNRPSTVGVMRMNGTLEGYLKEVNQAATEILESLVRQYATAEGVT